MNQTEETIWRRKIFFGGEGKGGKYLEKKDGETTKKEREENLSEKENVTVGGQADIVKIVLEF